HTRFSRDWSSDVCSSDLIGIEKGPSLWLKASYHTRFLPANEGPLTVRRRKAELHARVNGDLALEFTDVKLTSYAGLELLDRYLRSEERRVGKECRRTM